MRLDFNGSEVGSVVFEDSTGVHELNKLKFNGETVWTATPGAPENLAFDAQQQTLTWNAVEGTTQYELHWDRSDFNNAGESKVTLSGSVTQYTISNLIANSLYYFKVRAYNEGGFSDFSPSISGRTPPTSASISAQSYSPTEVKLTWDAVSNVTRYEIYQDGVLADTLVSTTSSPKQVIIDELSQGNYSFQVRGFTDSGLWNDSNTVVGSPGISPPAVELNAEQGIDSTKVSLTWNDNGADRYTISKKSSTNNKWVNIKTISPSDTSYYVTEDGFSGIRYNDTGESAERAEYQVYAYYVYEGAWGSSPGSNIIIWNFLPPLVAPKLQVNEVKLTDGVKFTVRHNGDEQGNIVYQYRNLSTYTYNIRRRSYYQGNVYNEAGDWVYGASSLSYEEVEQDIQEYINTVSTLYFEETISADSASDNFEIQGLDAGKYEIRAKYVRIVNGIETHSDWSIWNQFSYFPEVTCYMEADVTISSSNLSNINVFTKTGVVDWGNGTTSTIQSYASAYSPYTSEEVGNVYKIKIESYGRSAKINGQGITKVKVYTTEDTNDEYLGGSICSNTWDLLEIDASGYRCQGSWASFTYNCKNLTTVHLPDNIKPWSISRMFEGASKLKSVDMSTWDMSRVGTAASVPGINGESRGRFYRSFANCSRLEAIKGIESWDVSNVQDFTEFASWVGDRVTPEQFIAANDGKTHYDLRHWTDYTGSIAVNSCRFLRFIDPFTVPNFVAYGGTNGLQAETDGGPLGTVYFQFRRKATSWALFPEVTSDILDYNRFTVGLYSFSVVPSEWEVRGRVRLYDDLIPGAWTEWQSVVSR